MPTEPLPYFDKETVYDEQISPLVAQIIAICKREGMPLILSVAFRNDEDDGVGCCTTHLPGHENFHNAHAAIRRSEAQVFAITIRKGE